jgi:hypothetical protein
LFLLSSPEVRAAARWCGPAVAAIGIAFIVPIAVTANESPFAGWFLLHALSPERVLPLVGLGVGCALVSINAFGFALAFFAAGTAIGFATQDWINWVIYNVVHGATYLFLTGPLSCLAIGFALISGIRLLPWLLPAGAFIEGVMLAIAIFLANPSAGDPMFTWAPLLTAFWVVATVALTLRAFRREWFAIFGRILGSWTLAIGLLYGAALLMPILKPPPPADTSQESTRGTEFNRPIENPRKPKQSPADELRPEQP